MPNAFIRKLEGFKALSEADKNLLLAISSNSVEYDAHVDLIREGDSPDNVHLILDGLAIRYKIMPDGGRQIFAYLVPGDFCDVHVALLGEMDHSIATLSACTVVDIPRKTILEIFDDHPNIARALWWTSLVDEAVLREGITNLGRRTADVRIAHLFCELYTRLKAVGRVSGKSFELPITQQVVADTTGLSVVHVNRSLKVLREDGLVTFRGHSVEIHNLSRLSEYSGFDPNYLHLQRKKR